MIVMKFGGTSVGNGKRMLHVADIISSFYQQDQIVVVTSAMEGVTDRLISIFRNYQEKVYGDALSAIAQLYDSHMRAVDDLELEKTAAADLRQVLVHLFGQLLLYVTIHLEYSPLDYDYIVSFGERFSSVLLTAAFNKRSLTAHSVDASDIFITSNAFGNAKVLFFETRRKVQRHLSPLLARNILPVVSGFFGSTVEGQVATFGRGGSDYSATVLAHVLEAREVILWKEVDGVYRSDPKKDAAAEFLPELSYDQAIALARNGAKILHPDAMEPVSSLGIPILVKNTFRPELAGTRIGK